MRIAKIMDTDSLYRDLDTQAILPFDLSVVRKHEARVVEMMKDERREEEIATIKKDMSEIKDILKELCMGVPKKKTRRKGAR